jgi:hypothetical protein
MPPMTVVTSLRTPWLTLTVRADRALGEPVVGGPLDRAGMLGLEAGVLLGPGCLSFSATSALVRLETSCRRHVFPSGP